MGLEIHIFIIRVVEKHFLVNVSDRVIEFKSDKEITLSFVKS